MTETTNKAYKLKVVVECRKYNEENVCIETKYITIDTKIVVYPSDNLVPGGEDRIQKEISAMEKAELQAAENESMYDEFVSTNIIREVF